VGGERGRARTSRARRPRWLTRKGFEECAETVNGGVGGSEGLGIGAFGSLDFTKGLEEEVEPFDAGRWTR